VTIVTQLINHLKSDHLKLRDVILTNIKEVNILVESCFVYHKSDNNNNKFIHSCDID